MENMDSPTIKDHSEDIVVETFRKKYIRVIDICG